MQSQAFVTGGSGFVGRALLADLAQRGVACVAPVRRAEAADIVAGLGARPTIGSLLDVAWLTREMAGCSVIFHVAGETRALAPDATLVEANVTATVAVLEAAARAGVPRLVFVSTECVLVGRQPVVDSDETWPLPADHFDGYGRTKAQAERLVLAANSPTLTTIAVRPPWVWGPSDTTVIPQLRLIVAAGMFRWVGGGHHLRSVVHIQNLVEGLWLAAEKGRGGEAYFVTDGEPVELRSFLTRLLAAHDVVVGNGSMPRWFARALAAASEAGWRLLRLPGPPPLTRAQIRMGGEAITHNDAKARLELGYTNRLTTEEGLLALSPNRP